MKIVKFLSLTFAIVVLTTFIGCKKDNNGTSYPKTVEVTYKITSVSGSVTNITSGSYINATGGTSDLENIALPYTKTVSMTVNRGDDATLAFLHNNSATNTPFSIKLEILVNNKVVKTETFEGTSSATGAIAYLFY
ncbi:MAG: hypothetical protein ACK5NK_01100 [Niabella sp.]